MRLVVLKLFTPSRIVLKPLHMRGILLKLFMRSICFVV